MIQKIRSALSGKFRPLLLVGLLMLILSPTALAATVSQSFKPVGDVTPGNIVSLDKVANTVVKASSANINNLYGVVVDSSSVEFSGSTDGVLVVNTGVVNTLVSTRNGDIKAGDAITVNSLEGIGEKALAAGKIIGVAQGSLDASTVNAKSFDVSTANGTKNVIVGSVPIKVEVTTYNPLAGLTNGKSTDVTNRSKTLQIADSIAGKPVSAISLVAAGIVLVLSIFIASFLVTSSGYASMISLGRNPLSEKKIMQSLFKLVGIAVVIFVSGIVLAYLIIKLF